MRRDLHNADIVNESQCHPIGTANKDDAHAANQHGIKRQK